MQDGFQQCDFRFRFKECPQCNSENDIAARACQHCDHILVDPDTRLKQALQLRDTLVLRCSGMSMDEHKGRLKVCYYDEDGAELAEYFGLDNCRTARCLYQKFTRWHLRNPGEKFSPQSVTDVIAAQKINGAHQIL